MEVSKGETLNMNYLKFDHLLLVICKLWKHGDNQIVLMFNMKNLDILPKKEINLNKITYIVIIWPFKAKLWIKVKSLMVISC